MNYSWYLCFSCLHRVCLGKKCAPSNAENIILHLDQTSTYLQTEILIGVGQVQIRPGPRLDPRVFWETRTHPAPFLEDPEVDPSKIFRTRTHPGPKKMARDPSHAIKKSPDPSLDFKFKILIECHCKCQIEIRKMIMKLL